MKHLPKFIKLFCLLIILNSCTQDRKNSNQEILFTINSSLEIFEETKQTYSKIIDRKITKLNQKNDAQPIKYGLIKEQSDKLANSVNDLNSYLESLIVNYKINHIDTYNYTMMTDTMFLSNLSHKKNNALPEKGIKLKEKIDQFYQTNHEILKSYNREAKNYNDVKFNTSISFTNNEGESIDYINYKFTDKTEIGTLLGLKKLQLETKTLQIIFMNYIIQ